MTDLHVGRVTDIQKANDWFQESINCCRLGRIQTEAQRALAGGGLSAQPPRIRVDAVSVRVRQTQIINDADVTIGNMGHLHNVVAFAQL